MKLGPKMKSLVHIALGFRIDQEHIIARNFIAISHRLIIIHEIGYQ